MSGSGAANSGDFSAFDDHGTFVVNSNARDLPRVCLKTGVATRDRFHLKDRFLPRSNVTWAIVLGGAPGYWLAKETWGEKIDIRLPLSEDWLDAETHKAKFSWIFVFIGFIFFLVGMYLTFYNAIFGMIGFFALIAALIWAYWKGRPSSTPFTVVRVDEDWIWIQGVNPEVVSCFPPLPHDFRPGSVGLNPKQRTAPRAQIQNGSDTLRTKLDE